VDDFVVILRRLMVDTGWYRLMSRVNKSSRVNCDSPLDVGRQSRIVRQTAVVYVVKCVV